MIGSSFAQGMCGRSSCGAIPTDGVPSSSWFTSGSPTQVGQSFTLCADMTITELHVHIGFPPSASINGTLIIRNVAECGAPGMTSATIEHTQPITIDTTTGNQVFTLSTPFAVTANQTYAWILDGGSSFSYAISRSSVDYIGHSLMGGPGSGCLPGEATCNDALFAFNAPAFEEPSQEPIPTMGEWGIICLLLILIVIGVVSIRESSSVWVRAQT